MRLCFVLVIIMIFTNIGYAHPPDQIVASFNPEDKTLTVIVTHRINNPASHYIKKVEVDLNGKEIIDQAITKQENNHSQRFSYIIPDASYGDKLAVTGYCNINGKLKEELEIK